MPDTTSKAQPRHITARPAAAEQPAFRADCDARGDPRLEEQESDVALVAAARAGDDGAAERLVLRYQRDCWRFAYRMLGRRHDAEDAVQDAFLRVFRALPSYREQGRFRAWLLRILANQCRTVLAQRRRRARWIFGGKSVDEQPDPDDVAAPGRANPADPHLADALQEALARLDAKQREAFLLKYGEGMQYHDMATVTGASVPALKMRVKRACDTLRPMLRELHDAE